MPRWWLVGGASVLLLDRQVMRQSFLLPQGAGSRGNVAKCKHQCSEESGGDECRFLCLKGFTTLLLPLLFLVIAWGLVSNKLTSIGRGTLKGMSVCVLGCRCFCGDTCCRVTCL